MGDGFDEIVAESTPRVRDLAIGCRALIREVFPAMVEVPWPRQRVIGHGVGPRKMSEHFCYIAVQRDHVNLGFNYGAELPDPERLLEGPGKLLRHVKIASEEDLARPALRRLLETTSKHCMPAPSSQA